ncbi:MAG: hypothetical protein IKO39_07660, partial [Treponema sp.]|nr:hypothetical protein [Treponema sp.]
MPLVICLVWFNQFHHIALHILVFASVVFASNELYRILSKKFSLLPRPVVIVAAAVPAFVCAICAFPELDLSFID